MPYVYRYIDEDGKVVYVGKTIDLERRHYQHKFDSWYREWYDFQFIPVNTGVESEMLETHFIGLYSSAGMCKENISKKSCDYFGSDYIRVGEEEWREYKESAAIDFPPLRSGTLGNVKCYDTVYVFIKPCKEELGSHRYKKERYYYDNFDYGGFRYRKVNRVTDKYVECYGCWRYRRDNGSEIFFGGDEFNGLEATAYATEIEAVRAEREFLVSTYGKENYLEWLRNSCEFHDKELGKAFERGGFLFYEACEDPSAYPTPYLSEAARYKEEMLEWAK